MRVYNLAWYKLIKVSLRKSLNIFLSSRLLCSLIRNGSLSIYLIYVSALILSRTMVYFNIRSIFVVGAEEKICLKFGCDMIKILVINVVFFFVR